MSQLVLDVHSSLLAFCNTWATRWSAEVPTEVVNLDALITETELPTADVIGIRQFSMRSPSDHLPTATVSGTIVIVTRDDPTNSRLMTRLNEVFTALQPEAKHPLYDVQTETKTGELVVTGTTRLMPVHKTSVLAIQGITFQAAILRV